MNFQFHFMVFFCLTKKIIFWSKLGLSKVNFFVCRNFVYYSKFNYHFFDKNLIFVWEHFQFLETKIFSRNFCQNFIFCMAKFGLFFQNFIFFTNFLQNFIFRQKVIPRTKCVSCTPIRLRVNISWLIKIWFLPKNRNFFVTLSIAG